LWHTVLFCGGCVLDAFWWVWDVCCFGVAFGLEVCVCSYVVLLCWLFVVLFGWFVCYDVLGLFAWIALILLFCCFV